jgi:protein-L-isoaspartate(D-aspartate) O-methyltransferase
MIHRVFPAWILRLPRAVCPGKPGLALLCALLVGCSREPTSSPTLYADPALAGQDPARDEFARQREQLMRSLEEVVKDRSILEVMGRIPRHEFVPQPLRARSYVNTALPIQESQTISAPDVVALMTRELALQGTERVLEIGTGSGYQAAVLGELVPEVYSVEIRPALAAQARKTLEDLHHRGILRYKKIEVIVGDGYQGYQQAAPYDAIIVTAAPRQVPVELINQLKPGGRMVIPVGDFYQELQLIQKSADGKSFSTRNVLAVRFVPMVTGQ